MRNVLYLYGKNYTTWVKYNTKKINRKAYYIPRQEG